MSSTARSRRSSSRSTGGTGAEAVAHRVVHGGARFREPVADRRRGAQRDRGARRARAAPQSAGARGARARRRALPGRAAGRRVRHRVPRDAPAEAATYALPARWRERVGIAATASTGSTRARRARRAAGPRHRLVVCHLGDGCSVTAVRRPLGGHDDGLHAARGLMMATRSGSVDPGALLYVLRERGSRRELDRELNLESGLLGLRAARADMRELARGAGGGARDRRLRPPARRRRSRRWRRRSAASTRSSSRPGSGRTRRPSAPALRAARLPRRGARPGSEHAAEPDCEIGARARRCRSTCCARVRSSSPRGPRGGSSRPGRPDPRAGTLRPYEQGTEIAGRRW